MVTGEHPRLDQGHPLIPGEERRRSQRVIIRIAVTLTSTEPGQPVAVPGHTVSVNDQGALVICSRSFPAGTRLELLLNRTREHQACHVVRTPAETPDGFYAPVAFEKPKKGFWRITFPPVTHNVSEG